LSCVGMVDHPLATANGSVVARWGLVEFSLEPLNA
jgi:hypothetical protein